MPAETHVEQGPLDREEIFGIIRDSLADILEIEPTDIGEGFDTFFDDAEYFSYAEVGVTS